VGDNVGQGKVLPQTFRQSGEKNVGFLLTVIEEADPLPGQRDQPWRWRQAFRDAERWVENFYACCGM